MNVRVFDLGELPQRVSELVEMASRAGEVVLTRRGEAVARIVPLHHARAPRQGGGGGDDPPGG
ncbi:MAG TPA: hypothetical protein VF771_15040 [Longimicrobiaceae bacterium]